MPSHAGCRSAFRWRAMHCLVVALMTASALEGCGGSRDGSIVVDREVRLEGVCGTPFAIVRTADGGFVIAGGCGDAWAAGTTSTGILRWRYGEPAPQNRSPVASYFKGAVALANGHVLLCGQHHQRALVTILDETGQLVERRDISPPDGNAAISVSSIDWCLPWNDGVALVGGGSDGHQGYFWLLKLDKNGSQEWGRVSDKGVAGSAIQAPNGDLITAHTATDLTDNSYHSELIRYDHLGNPVAQRLIHEPSIRVILLRPIGTPAEHVRAIRYGDGEAMLTLNSQLQDAMSPIHIAPISLASPSGCGYVLPDGSAALFGQAGNRSAIARVGRHWKFDAVRLFRLPNVGGATVSVGDAVPLSANQFVSVRDEESAGGPSRMVLSWITFQ